MVFISDVKFRPFIGSSDICVLSTRYALSAVLVATRGLDSASTDTASVTLPTARAICPTSSLVLTSSVTVISAFLNPDFSTLITYLPG